MVDFTCEEPSPRAEERIRRIRFQETIRKYYRSMKDWMPYHVLCGMAFIVILVLIILAASFKSYSHELSAEKCTSSECLKDAALMVEMADLKVNPCFDPWTWACGSWISNKSGNPSNTVRTREKDLLRNEYIKFRDLITAKTISYIDESAESKMRIIYNSCMQEDESLTRVYFADLLQKMNLNQRRPKMDILRHMILKSQSLHEKNPFFSVQLIQTNSYHYPEDVVIQIGYPKLGLPSRYYQNDTKHNMVVLAYKSLLTDSLKTTGKSDIKSTSIANNFYNFEKRLAGIIRENDFKTGKNEYTTIKELKTRMPNFPIEEVIFNFFTDSVIQPRTQILVQSYAYFTSLSQLVFNTRDERLFDYITGWTVKEMIPFGGKHLNHAMHKFTNIVTGYKRKVPRWDVCVSYIKNTMTLAYHGLLFRNLDDTVGFNKRTKIINEMYNYMKLSIYEEISSNDNFDKNMQDYLIHQVSTVQLRTGIPFEELNEDYLNWYYENLSVTNDFYQNMKQITAFKRSLYSHAYNGLAENKTESFLLSLEVQDTVQYDVNKNVIVIPSYLIDRNNFNEYLPIPIQYGRIGTKIAEAIIQGMYYMNDNGETISSLYFDIVAETSYVVFNCVNKIYTRYNQKMNHRTILNTIIESIGVKVTEQAMIRHMDVEKRHVHVPGLDKYEGGGLFILNYIQNKCEVESMQFYEWNIASKFYLQPKTMISVIWRNLLSFYLDFPCEARNVLKNNACELYI